MTPLPRNGATAAHALDLPLLEHAQQRDLRLGRKVADLVEKDRSGMRQLEAARRCCSAPVKAPFSWPKSSEAISEAGIAEQFTVMNAWPERRERL